MRVGGLLWTASLVLVLIVGLKAYGWDWDLSTFLIGFGILAIGPALLLILVFALVGTDNPDKGRPSASRERHRAAAGDPPGPRTAAQR
jgi:hypothetical protein